jgi:DNA-binding NtrC family response regulator
VHCAALPATLLESELFGHEKGSFTGAHQRHIGRFEQANGGTLFLDEIGEIDPVVQVKLLRFLGERSFERVGSSRTLTADVRLVAATNKNLADAVKAGTFREDLYYRLKVVEIHLPALRDRRGDIPLLAQTFMREFARANEKTVDDFAPEALEAITGYPWPGNVRELRSAIEHAVLFCRGQHITLRDLPAEVRSGPPLPSNQPAASDLKASERQLIAKALRETGGNRTAAAERLGISRRTLHRKLRTHQLEDL